MTFLAMKHVYPPSELQTCMCTEVLWFAICIPPDEEYPWCCKCLKAVLSTQTLVGMAHGSGRPGLRWALFVFRVLFEAD